ncbi:hypothetical protein PSV3_00148 [Septimatrevirus PSV32]|uniref:Uncharacterized protein n=1 Tax=Pseudomonas phage PSV3 TaxID=3003632 RepID=A0AAF0AQ01_9CAUD|nr:hypothetical protein PM409_gp45 [Pseudomonas phage PSV3]WBF76850.1 hypothetical protein PSV3_00148 [Pseudomonas phage PSV3]
MKIDSNIPLPPEDEAPAAEPAKQKPRARRQAAAGKNKAKGPSPAASLLAALKFVAIAQKKAGPTNVGAKASRSRKEQSQRAKPCGVAFGGVEVRCHRAEKGRADERSVRAYCPQLGGGFRRGFDRRASNRTRLGSVPAYVAVYRRAVEGRRRTVDYAAYPTGF